MLVTVIGRGHSGTRAMAHTLTAGGVFMGAPLNASGDLLPPEAMYEACRVMARHVRHLGGLKWDFNALHSMPIPKEFKTLIETYLSSVMRSTAENRGWKIPETTLVYPWIRRMFPDIKYIFWVRNPRDCIIGSHLTDNLADFGVPCPTTTNVRERRAISWIYQHEIVKSTPSPTSGITVRFEDFVLKQKQTIRKLQEFLGIELPLIPVRPEAVDRWKTDEDVNYFGLFEPAMKHYGYDIPVLEHSSKEKASCA